MTSFEVRPPCPKCGMNMVKIDARFECLRCGHVEKPAMPKAAASQTPDDPPLGFESSKSPPGPPELP